MPRRLLPAMLAVLALAYTGGSWYFSNIIVKPDRRAPEADRQKIEAAWGPMSLPAAPQELRVAVDGGELAASFYANDDPAGCAMILLHGQGGTRFSGLRFMPLYWDRGCDVLSPDLRGHGLSTAEWVTYGARERGDVLALVDWLVTEKGYAREQIGLHGVSMGGSVALLTAALEPELAFVAGDSTFASLDRIVTEQGEIQYGAAIYLMIPGAFALAQWRAGFDMDNAAPVTVVDELLMPVFLLHPEGDTYTNVAHGRALAEQLDPAHGVFHVTQWGEDHAESVYVNREGYKALLDAFLEAQVPGFGRAPGALEPEPEGGATAGAAAEGAPAEGGPAEGDVVEGGAPSAAATEG